MFLLLSGETGIVPGLEVGPNLWLAAAKGLGFFVQVVWFKDTEFRCTNTDPEHSPRFLKWVSYCKCHPNLAVIFVDAASLLELHNLAQWHAWKVPHSFFADPSLEPVPPGGWQACSRGLRSLDIGWFHNLLVEIGRVVSSRVGPMRTCDCPETALDSFACSYR